MGRSSDRPTPEERAVGRNGEVIISRAHWLYDYGHITAQAQDVVEDEIRAAVEAEREACAVVAEEEQATWNPRVFKTIRCAVDVVAQRIRARGDR